MRAWFGTEVDVARKTSIALVVADTGRPEWALAWYTHMRDLAARFGGSFTTNFELFVAGYGGRVPEPGTAPREGFEALCADMWASFERNGVVEVEGRLMDRGVRARVRVLDIEDTPHDPRVGFASVPAGWVRQDPSETEPVDDGSGRTYVYFALNPKGHIKIGHSANPWARVKRLQKDPTKGGSRGSLRLVATLRSGGRTLEQQLHQRFDSLRIEGEWFACTPEIVQWIAENARLTKDGRDMLLVAVSQRPSQRVAANVAATPAPVDGGAHGGVALEPARLRDCEGLGYSPETTETTTTTEGTPERGAHQPAQSSQSSSKGPAARTDELPAEGPSPEDLAAAEIRKLEGRLRHGGVKLEAINAAAVWRRWNPGSGKLAELRDFWTPVAVLSARHETDHMQSALAQFAASKTRIGKPNRWLESTVMGIAAEREHAENKGLAVGAVQHEDRLAAVERRRREIAERNARLAEDGAA